MAELHIVALLWDANKHSAKFSSMYDESWVEKLYRSFARNLTAPFKFVCFVDRPRQFNEPIEQELIADYKVPRYAALIEPFKLNVPMILVGLDTMVVDNIDHLAQYCMTPGPVAVPTAAYDPKTTCNGVSLVPEGHRDIYDRHNGENDMLWMRKQKTDRIDNLWPKQVVSYKTYVKENGLEGVKIVFFHGEEKPHQLQHLPWIREQWV